MTTYLTINDFKKVKTGAFYYYSFYFEGKELTLEPCNNGFDISLYDLDGVSLRPKQCLNVPDNEVLDFWKNLEQAVEVANQIYQEV